MTSLFASVPGKVVRMPTTYAAPRTTMQFSDTAQFNYITLGCILTKAAVKQRGNFQVLQSVGDLIYFDTFGDEVAAVAVSGLAFLDTCEAGASGVDNFLNYYNSNRMAARNTPISMLFGSTLFQGFLAESELEISDPEMGLGMFSMQFITLPQISSPAGNAGGNGNVAAGGSD